MNIFNKRVKELRLCKNLSLRQLSSLSGLSPSAIHAYEIGSREPTLSSLEALSDVFNCDIDYLLGKSDIKNSEAQALGYDSLYEAWVNGALIDKTTPTEVDLSEGERIWLELYRKLSPDVRDTFTALIDIFDKLPDGVRQMLYASMSAAIAAQNKKST